MSRPWLGESVLHVAQALREPEAFALRWQRGEAEYRWWVWQALIATAILGTTTYGMTMGILGGVERIVWAGLVVRWRPGCRGEFLSRRCTSLTA